MPSLPVVASRRAIYLLRFGVTGQYGCVLVQVEDKGEGRGDRPLCQQAPSYPQPTRYTLQPPPPLAKPLVNISGWPYEQTKKRNAAAPSFRAP